MKDFNKPKPNVTKVDYSSTWFPTEILGYNPPNSLNRPLGYNYLAPSLGDVILRCNSYSIPELTDDIEHLNVDKLTQQN